MAAAGRTSLPDGRVILVSILGGQITQITPQPLRDRTSKCLLFYLVVQSDSLPSPLDAFMAPLEAALGLISVGSLSTRDLAESVSGQDSADDSSLLLDSDDEARRRGLGNRISEGLQMSAFDSRVFLPEGLIEELVLEDAVREELNIPSKKKDEDRIVDFVFTNGHGAKKLFVIALLVGVPKESLWLAKAMLRFRKANVRDSSLPIINQETSPAFYDNGGAVLSPWTAITIRNFCNHQWAVLTPVFTDQNLRLYLEPGHILPIVEKAHIGSSGAFGEVVRVKLHDKHHRNPILRVRTLAQVHLLRGC